MNERDNLWVLVLKIGDICGNVTSQPGRVKHVAESREECEAAMDRYFERPRSGQHNFCISRWSDLDWRERRAAGAWMARRETV